MEYEDQEEEQDGELGLGPGYNDPLENSNSTRAPPPPPTKMSSAVDAPPPIGLKPRYKECLKNHALGIGGRAVDGCGEFMPSGEEGTLESLKCAACNCHRNFHRKEADIATADAFPFRQHPPPPQLFLTHHPHGHFGYLHHQRTAPPPLALPSSSGGGGSRDEVEDIFYSGGAAATGKKRSRTKFTQEQKEKMLDLAVRLDWKLQKTDEELVQQFCGEMGIKRHVFKVWMHNNKHTLGKKT